VRVPQTKPGYGLCGFRQQKFIEAKRLEERADSWFWVANDTFQIRIGTDDIAVLDFGLVPDNILMIPVAYGPGIALIADFGHLDKIPSQTSVRACFSKWDRITYLHLPTAK
jgi:hypothetical protein